MNPPESQLRRHIGFTLIELLLVIVIIGLLIAITLPALQGARQRASAVRCLSNIRQVGTAVNAFVADHQGRLPENRTDIGNNEHTTWRHMLTQANYLPTGDIWACPTPAPSEPVSEEGRVDRQSLCVGDVESNWALNGHILWRDQPGELEAERPAVVIRRPSHTILLAESRTYFPDLRVTDNILATFDDIGGWYGFWHDGDGSYFFGDGHAEHVQLLDTGSPDCRWHNGRDNATDDVDPQSPEEVPVHDHPDWAFLAPPIYR